MTVLESVLLKIERISEFKIGPKEFLLGDRTSNTIHIGDIVHFEYIDYTNRTINLLHKAFTEIASSANKIEAKKQLDSIYRLVSELPWESNLKLDDIVIETTEGEFLFPMLGVDLRKELKTFLVLKSSILSDLQDVIVRYDCYNEGLKLELQDTNIISCYNFLVLKNIIEDNQEDNFLASLSGGKVIGSVKWKDGTKLARFFKGCSAHFVKGDCFGKKKINSKETVTVQWQRIVDVFQFDFKGNRLTEKINRNLTSKGFKSDPVMKEALDILTERSI